MKKIVLTYKDLVSVNVNAEYQLAQFLENAYRGKLPIR